MATLSPMTKTNGGVVDLATSGSAAASGGDEFTAQPGKGYTLAVQNGGGGSVTLTIAVQDSTIETADAGEVTLSDLTYDVADGDTALIEAPGPAYRDGNGRVQLSYSGVTSVIVGVFETDVY